MFLSPLERIRAQRTLFDSREGSRFMYVCIPLLIQEKFDEDTQSANNITESNGLGQIASEWRVYALRAHFRNVDNSLMAYGHIPPGVETGDCLVNFGPRDLGAIQQTIDNDDAYLIIDGETYHSVSLIPTGLGRNEEWCLDARKYEPKFRAPGH